MPSRSDFGFDSDAPDSERRRARRYADDESGARPLPNEARYPDPLDERVDLPIERSNALTFFGIGAGLGVAAISIGAALYFGGYFDEPRLAPTPEASSLEPESRLAPLQQASDDDALAFARVANAKLASPPVFSLPPAVESPDISVTEEQAAQPAPSPAPPAKAPASRAPRRPSSLGEELEDLDQAQPTPMPVPTEPPMPPPAQSTAPAEEAPDNPDNP